MEIFVEPSVIYAQPSCRSSQGY